MMTQLGRKISVEERPTIPPSGSVRQWLLDDARRRLDRVIAYLGMTDWRRVDCRLRPHKEQEIFGSGAELHIQYREGVAVITDFGSRDTILVSYATHDEALMAVVSRPADADEPRTQAAALVITGQGDFARRWPAASV